MQFDPCYKPLDAACNCDPSVMPYCPECRPKPQRRFYVATMKQENARPVRDVIVAAKCVCTATWLDLTTYGSVPQPDTDRRRASETCHREVSEADALVLVSEPDGVLVRGGKHVETGMALALHKPVHVILGPHYAASGKRENVFHWHPLVRVHDDLAASAEWLKAVQS